MSDSLKHCLPFVLLYSLLTFLVAGNGYFWDTVQFGSLHAHFYFENNFQEFILPIEMDSGHPPFFGMYIAGMWKIFGKQLWVSHFAMLPFLIGNIFLLYQLGRYFLNDTYAFTFPLLCLFDPVYIGQATLVSPDILLCFFFLTGILGVVREQLIWKAIGLLGLSLISTRGMMCMVIIFLVDLFLWIRKEPIKNTLISIPVYLPSALTGFGFLFYHYQQTGWLGYHEGSSWAPAFERVGPTGLLKNFAVLAWRLLDFGRVFILLIIVLAGAYGLKNRVNLTKPAKILILLITICFIILTPSLLLYKNINGHRYLLPLFLLINFLAIHLIYHTFLRQKVRQLYFAIAFLGLLTGNLWVYPDYISQGWDSTLAHLPYYNLRDNMIRFIDDKKIPYSEIGTCFPNKLPQKYIDLKSNTIPFADKDLSKNQFIFYSNIFNDFTDQELMTLANDWESVKEFSHLRIRVILFKKKEG